MKTLEQRIRRIEEKVSLEETTNHNKNQADFLEKFENKIERLFELSMSFGSDITDYYSYPDLEREMRRSLIKVWNKSCKPSNRL